MDKPKNLFLYEVSSASGRKIHIYATSGDQAKRIYCKDRNIRPSDYFCGTSSLKARKMKPDEVKAWEEQAAAERATYLFIKGMLDISVKAHAEQAANKQGVTA